MFREFVDAVDDFDWLSDDDVYVVDSPFGYVRMLDVKLRWASDGPGDPAVGAVFVVDSKGPFIQHALIFGSDPDHEVAGEWALDRNVFFLAGSVGELRQYVSEPHSTGWRIVRA